MGPMSGWSDSVTPIPPPSSARPGVRTMAYAGLVTGGWAGLVCLVLYGIARLFGVPMEVDTMDGVAVVPWFLVLLIPVVAGVIGAIAALVLRGRRHAVQRAQLRRAQRRGPRRGDFYRVARV